MSSRVLLLLADRSFFHRTIVQEKLACSFEGTRRECPVILRVDQGVEAPNLAEEEEQGEGQGEGKEGAEIRGRSGGSSSSAAKYLFLSVRLASEYVSPILHKLDNP